MAKEWRFQTYAHHYGYGNVHRYVYDPDTKTRYCLCQGPGAAPYHGKVVERGAQMAVTCRRCDPSTEYLIPAPMP